eukprot:TRINITY_DN55072_c0_g1_i4.p1 TRINITY_DN55072_c0_g1~~TRINITY_DN55072_c0_g1_i4.p1  ORF type:complete len:328 (-),score=81.97 TRINITY_DN55072_c0_g1_i4:162-1034(-)
MLRSLVGSEMCIRDSPNPNPLPNPNPNPGCGPEEGVLHSKPGPHPHPHSARRSESDVEELTSFMRGRVAALLGPGTKLRADEPWDHVVVMELLAVEGQAGYGHDTAVSGHDTAGLTGTQVWYHLEIECSWKAVLMERQDKLDASFPPPQGMIRVYNVTDKTVFAPGGDEASSWGYQLGYGEGLSKEEAEAVKRIGDGLFFRVSGIMKAIVSQLKKKAAGSEDTGAPVAVESVSTSADLQTRMSEQLAAKKSHGMRGVLNRKGPLPKCKKPLREWAEERKPKGFRKGFLDR